MYGIPWHQPGLATALLHGISCPGCVPNVGLGKAGGLFPAVLCPGRASPEHPQGQTEGEQWSGQQGGMGQVQGDSGEEKGRSLSLPPAAEVSFLFTVSSGSLPEAVSLLGRNDPSCQKIP